MHPQPHAACKSSLPKPSHLAVVRGSVGSAGGSMVLFSVNIQPRVVRGCRKGSLNWGMVKSSLFWGHS